MILGVIFVILLTMVYFVHMVSVIHVGVDKCTSGLFVLILCFVPPLAFFSIDYWREIIEILNTIKFSIKELMHDFKNFYSA